MYNEPNFPKAQIRHNESHLKKKHWILYNYAMLFSSLLGFHNASSEERSSKHSVAYSEEATVMLTVMLTEWQRMCICYIPHQPLFSFLLSPSSSSLSNNRYRILHFCSSFRGPSDPSLWPRKQYCWLCFNIAAPSSLAWGKSNCVDLPCKENYSYVWFWTGTPTEFGTPSIPTYFQYCFPLLELCTLRRFRQIFKTKSDCSCQFGGLSRLDSDILIYNTTCFSSKKKKKRRFRQEILLICICFTGQSLKIPLSTPWFLYHVSWWLNNIRAYV